jgi:pimeloyl-ACP methyl ester carboxylesterase
MRPRAQGSGVGALPTREARVRRLYFDQRLADAALSHDPSEQQLDIEENNWRTTALLGGATFHNPNLESRVARIQRRSLLLWGRQDAVIGFDQASAWRQALPQSEVVPFDECGHLPHVEKVQLAAEAVVRFLS